MQIVTLILATGLVGRLTILTTRDTITQNFRIGFINLMRQRQWAAQFITCHWCVSVWYSFAVAPFAYWAGHTAWFIIPATMGSISFAASLLSDR